PLGGVRDDLGHAFEPEPVIPGVAPLRLGRALRGAESRQGVPRRRGDPQPEPGLGVRPPHDAVAPLRLPARRHPPRVGARLPVPRRLGGQPGRRPQRHGLVALADRRPPRRPGAGARREHREDGHAGDGPGPCPSPLHARLSQAPRLRAVQVAPRTVAPRGPGSRIFGRARRVAGRPGVAVPPPVPEAPPRTAARLARRVPVPPPAPQRPRDPRPPEDARPAQRRPRAPLPRTPRAPGTALPPWTRAPGTALRPWALSPRTALYPGAALRPRDAARQREPPHRDAADPVREGVR